MFAHKMVRSSTLALTTLILATMIVTPHAAQADSLPDLSNRFIFFNMNRAYDPSSSADGILEIKTVNTESGELEGQLSIKKEPSQQVTGRIVLEGSSGPYGTDTCHQGYVWREAVPNDLVCVTPQTRSQARYDNSQDSARKVPTPPSPPGSFSSISDACRQGYVWREAISDDRVCVTPQTRAQTRYDNSQAAERRLGTLQLTFATKEKEFWLPDIGIQEGYSFTGELRNLGVSQGIQDWGVNGSYSFTPLRTFPFEGSTIKYTPPH